MISPIKDLPFDDYTELFPAVTSIAVMVFTYNIGFGFAAGFLTYPIFKIAALVGDVLFYFGRHFPMTSFRLRSMTTDNIIDLSNSR